MTKEKRIGMYGETPQVKVGKYTISRQNPDGKNDSVWIQIEDEEGGAFPDELFEKAVDSFFEKYF